MLVEVVSVVLRAPIDSTSEDSKDLSLLVLCGQSNKRYMLLKLTAHTDETNSKLIFQSIKKIKLQKLLKSINRFR